MKRLMLSVAAAVLATSSAGIALAQESGARPIRMIVPFSGGSASDVITRILVERISITTGQRFVLDNRPAAGGNLGTHMLAKATPDGYSFGMSASGPLAANKTLYKELVYDPERDIQPVSLFASLPNIVVVSAKLPAQTINELIDYVKKTPGVPYGSVGNGSAQHLAGAFFEQIVGARMTHDACAVQGDGQPGDRSGVGPGAGEFSTVAECARADQGRAGAPADRGGHPAPLGAAGCAHFGGGGHQGLCVGGMVRVHRAGWHPAHGSGQTLQRHRCRDHRYVGTHAVH